jgi:glycosyltransferase involved in cell wall biosynthesis
MSYNQPQPTERLRLEESVPEIEAAGFKSEGAAKTALRHCMVVHNYYPFAETRVQRQAEALVNQGLAVDIICLRHEAGPAVDEVGGATIYRLPLGRNKKGGAVSQFFEYLSFLILAFFKLTGLHLRQRYQTVQVHNLPDFLVFAALLPKLSGARVILDLHDLMPEFYCAKFNTTMSSWPVRLIRWQEWMSCRFANHVITVTELWRQTLIERGVSPDKCSVVMNLADTRHFNATLTPVQPDKAGPFHLIYHGTLTQRYGIDLVLRALDRLRHEIPEVRLTIQGRGEYLETLQRLAAELNLGEHVRFGSDFLPITDLFELIRSAHVGFVPYRRDVFTDGILPTKLMEYAALGVPAVVARTPVISAYFDETMVEFFTSEDIDDLIYHIRLLYHDRARLNELARNTIKFHQRYNWPNQSAEYVRLITNLANK